jgi:hypothetical protein
MNSNLDRFKKDLECLSYDGYQLLNGLQYQCFPDEYVARIKEEFKTKAESDAFIKKTPDFSEGYQNWYSESLFLIKQLLPDRLLDFTKLYEKPKTKRKEITCENYTIEDCLGGLTVRRAGEIIVGPTAAITLFIQQLKILGSVKKRFESSLFDIKQLVQADLFDSELDAAKELNIKGFARGAGAIAGVVLEKHLLQVCINHKIQINKKDPSIADLNDKLKEASVYEIPTWRKMQLLADLRNQCDHKKKLDPKTEDIEELIDGVSKITKTIF